MAELKLSLHVRLEYHVAIVSQYDNATLEAFCLGFRIFSKTGRLFSKVDLGSSGLSGC
jgi:hypothetical protein